MPRFPRRGRTGVSEPWQAAFALAVNLRAGHLPGDGPPLADELRLLQRGEPDDGSRTTNTGWGLWRTWSRRRAWLIDRATTRRKLGRAYRPPHGSPSSCFNREARSELASPAREHVRAGLDASRVAMWRSVRKRAPSRATGPCSACRCTDGRRSASDPSACLDKHHDDVRLSRRRGGRKRLLRLIRRGAGRAEVRRRPRILRASIGTSLLDTERLTVQSAFSRFFDVGVLDVARGPAPSIARLEPGFPFCHPRGRDTDGRLSA